MNGNKKEASLILTQKPLANAVYAEKTREQRQGAYFPYYSPHLDLRRYGIFKDATTASYDENCLIMSMIESDLEPAIIRKARAHVQTRDFPPRRLKDLAIAIGLGIILHSPRTAKNYDGKKVTTYSAGVDDAPSIELGLIEGHYFPYDRETEYTSYFVRHYDTAHELSIERKERFDAYRKATNFVRNVKGELKAYSVARHASYVNSWVLIRGLLKSKNAFKPITDASNIGHPDLYKKQIEAGDCECEQPVDFVPNDDDPTDPNQILPKDQEKMITVSDVARAQQQGTNDIERSTSSSAAAPACRKEDYVQIARSRRLAYTERSLWKRSTPDLARDFAPVAKEYAEVLARQAIRTNFERTNTNLSTADLKSQLRAAGSTLPAGITRSGMIDRLVALGGAKLPIQLDPDQLAALERKNETRLVIHAGPGAGKTTTICHIALAICASDPNARMLALAYNRAAATTLIGRVKRLGVPRIPNTRIRDETSKGIAILTFDKLAYQINGYAEDGGRDSYRKAFDAALPKLADNSQAAGLWHVIIVDEAQDILPHHAAMITQLCLAANAPRLIVAGDPRQELYPGARWFSELWATTPSAERHTLRYNHRSAPEIVEVLNAFSRDNFPQLHHEQIPMRTSAGRVESHILRTPGGWQYDALASARDVGLAASDAIARGGNCYAVCPVSVSKFAMQAATTMVRQRVPELIPGNLVYVIEGDDAPLPATARVYAVATSSKVKGTERDRVVVYGTDIDYSIMISREEIIKRIYVALSRARDELVIITRDHAHPVPTTIMRAVHAITGKKPIPSRCQTRAVDRPPYIAVVGEGALASGLCASPAISTQRIGEPIKGPALNLGVGHADADFLGLYAEALIAEALGVHLATAIKIVEIEDPATLGLYPSADGMYTMRVGPKKSSAARASINEVLLTAPRHSAAYIHTTLRYSALIGRAWTVSERLVGEAEMHTQPATAMAAWLTALAGGGVEGRYLVRGRELVACRRAPPDAIAGEIVYEIDLVLGTNTPVELKYVAKLTDVHRRQAGIYAAMCRTDRALLVNARQGIAEWIAAPNMHQIVGVARASLAVRKGRSQAIGPLYDSAVCPPDDLLTTNCLIAVDAETTEYGALTEIGAVAFSPVDWTVLAVFDERAVGIAEVETCMPYVQETETRLGVDIVAMTGLVGDPRKGDSDALISTFRSWFRELSSSRVFLHWCGSEREIIGDSTELTFDVCHGIFRPWLELSGAGRHNILRLHDAMSQVAPHTAFTPHRAFEDAIATAVVSTATLNFGGRL